MEKIELKNNQYIVSKFFVDIKNFKYNYFHCFCFIYNPSVEYIINIY